ncbi:hypothetical protein [Craterilacuibacter sp. RT1T]|uniref:hypothetical protein n=1 Tax=Craterilacuibacter sp. RT1T TaxID=2942211 RepID=UPI0020BEAE48|nr:hypothetical protein [Craterilacuibacter sp. RT1T]MCL6263160.1 hypothetical protein [Craterilacuibacter sp. RT1T]
MSLLKKHGKKLVVAIVPAVVAAPSFAASAIEWGTVATGATAEATAAMTAGIGLFALFLGVSAGIKMIRKFVG